MQCSFTISSYLSSYTYIGTKLSPDTTTVTVAIALSSVITLATAVLFVSLGIVCFSMKKNQRGDDFVQAKTTQPAPLRFVDIYTVKSRLIRVRNWYTLSIWIGYVT